MSPTGPNKYLGGITPIKTDQLELHLFKKWAIIPVKSWRNSRQIHIPIFNS